MTINGKRGTPSRLFPSLCFYSIMAMQGFCKPLIGVRFTVEALYQRTRLWRMTAKRGSRPQGIGHTSLVEQGGGTRVVGNSPGVSQAGTIMNGVSARYCETDPEGNSSVKVKSDRLHLKI